MKIFVKAKPRAKVEKVEKVDGGHYQVWIKEPPQKGKANATIVRLLVNYFGSADIKMVSGFSSSQKIFEIKHK